MPANLENSALAKDWRRSIFIPIPKEGSAKECSNYHTIALISHPKKVMLKILQSRFQQFVNWELPDVKAGFRKGRGTRSQITNIHRIIEKQGNSKTKIYFCFLTALKPLTVWITTKWKILKEKRIPDQLTSLLRNQYAGQEATVTTRHGTTDWFQIGKGVHQGCVLSPCLFNFYASYRVNASLDEAQAGITVAGRNINNLR